MIWKGDMVLNIWIYQGKGVDGVPGIGVGFQEPDGVPDERDCSHDVSKASNEPSPSSVDFRPTCGLAWAGCQSIPPAGVDWLSLSLFFPLGASLFCFRWKCSEYLGLFASMRPADIIKRKRPLGVWFPYTGIQRLWCQLEELIRNTAW